MAKVEFINRVGGRMFVDESRVDDYVKAGYLLASNVIDSTATDVEVVEKPTERKKTTSRRKKEV